MPCWVLSFFIASLSLWLVIKKVRKNSEEVPMNFTAYTYYVMLMAKCMCVWLHHPLKLLTSVLLQCTNSSQPGMFLCWVLYACSWAVIYQYSCCYNRYQVSTTIDWKIVHQVWFRSRTYAWTNRLTCFSTCILPIQLLIV